MENVACGHLLHGGGGGAGAHSSHSFLKGTLQEYRIQPCRE